MTAEEARPGSGARASGAGEDDRSALHDVWGILRRQRWLVAAVTAAIVLLTLAFLLIVSPTYRAAASLRIEEQKPQAGMLQALEALSGGAEVETELQVLKSRSLLEQVIDSLDLHVELVRPGPLHRQGLFRSLDAGREAAAGVYRLERVGEGRYEASVELLIPAPPGSVFGFTDSRTEELGTVAVGEPADLKGLRFTLADSAAAFPEIRLRVRPFQAAVEIHQRRLAVGRPDRNASVLVASFEGPNPRTVRAVPNLLAHEYIRRRQRVQSSEARNTVSFLGAQLDSLERQLNASERELRRFQERTDLIAPEVQAESEVERLAEMQARRDMLQTERQGLSDLLAQVEAEVADAGPEEESPYRRLVAFPTLFQNTASSELLKLLAELDTRRADLLARFTPRDPAARAVTERIAALERQLHRIVVTYLDGLDDQLTTLDAQLAQYRGRLEELPAEQIRLARLRRETDVLGEIYRLLVTRREEAQVAAAVKDPSAHVVDAAVLPREPVSPKPWLSLALAVVLGGGLGAGAAFLRERLDTALHTSEDLEAASGVPVLAVIPSMPDLLTDLDSMDPVAETFRELRTNLAFTGRDGTPQLVVVTSPLPGDGKSTVATNLAIMLARRTDTEGVLLVDADLRRGELGETLGVAPGPGLADVLVGRASLEEALREVDPGEGGGRLHLLPSGTRPPNPTELLENDRAAELLESARGRYANVIVDVPPLNLVADAAVVGSRSDGVLLVARAGVSESGAVSHAMSQLAKAEVQVLGAVLNDADVERQARYGRYGEGYAYYGRA